MERFCVLEIVDMLLAIPEEKVLVALVNSKEGDQGSSVVVTNIFQKCVT